MKKFKLVSMVLLLLTMVLVLASCGLRSFDDLVDADYEPVDTDPAYTTVNEIGALVDLEQAGHAGDLQLFKKVDPLTGLTKYVVYDVANDKNVWQKEETNSESATAKSTVQYTVSLNTLNEASYFTVTQTTTSQTLEDGIPVKTDTAKLVSIYASNGSSYVELVRAEDPRQNAQIAQDLLYFEGKCYRADENGSIAYAFDYSTFAKFPTISHVTPDYYVERSGDMWIVYDKTLNRLCAYDLPSFAEVTYSRVLGNNLFVQYFIMEDVFSDNYDVITEDNEKLTLYTVLIDLEKGKEKEIKTNYVVDSTLLVSSSPVWELRGFKDMEEDDVAIVRIFEVVDKRIDEADLAAQIAVLDADGEIKPMDMPVDMPVDSISFVAKGLWSIKTTDGRAYLVDAEGEVKQEITQASVDASSYIIANGKLYDLNLQVVYDYKADDLEYKFSTAKAVFFTNEDDELILYTASQKTTLISKRDAQNGIREYSNAYSSLENGYFVIVDKSDENNTKYEIYNIEGKLLKTIGSTVQFSISTVFRADDGKICLAKITTKAKDADKATAAYYVFK